MIGCSCDGNETKQQQKETNAKQVFRARGDVVGRGGRGMLWVLFLALALLALFEQLDCDFQCVHSRSIANACLARGGRLMY